MIQCQQALKKLYPAILEKQFVGSFMNKFLLFRMFCAFLIFFPLFACSPNSNKQRILTEESPVSTLVPSSTSTTTSTITLTPSPSPTFTPLSTDTPTPILLAEFGTPIPTALPPITLENASQVSGLTEWYEETVTDLAWTPDGRILAVSDGSGINLYDIETFQLRRSLYPKNPGIVDIEFSPRGTWLIAGSRRGDEETGYASSLEGWLGSDWKPLGLLYGVGKALSGMAFSPNGWYFAIAYASSRYSQNSVDIWNVTTWTISDTLKTGTVLDVAFSTDGNMLASSPDRYAIRIWDLQAGEWSYSFHTSFTGAVTKLIFSPDGVTLATGHYDGTIRLWDLRTGEMVLLIESEEVIESLAFSPDGRLLASGGSYENNYVRLWSTSSGALLNTMEGHKNGISHLCFSPDSQFLISASYDGAIRVWGIRP